MLSIAQKFQEIKNSLQEGQTVDYVASFFAMDVLEESKEIEKAQAEGFTVEEATDSAGRKIYKIGKPMPEPEPEPVPTIEVEEVQLSDSMWGADNKIASHEDRAVIKEILQAFAANPSEDIDAWMDSHLLLS